MKNNKMKQLQKFIKNPIAQRYRMWSHPFTIPFHINSASRMGQPKIPLTCPEQNTQSK